MSARHSFILKHINISFKCCQKSTWTQYWYSTIEVMLLRNPKNKNVDIFFTSFHFLFVAFFLVFWTMHAMFSPILWLPQHNNSLLSLLQELLAYFLYSQESLSPCWSVLEFWKIKLGNSSLKNWIFSLQKSVSKLIFVAYKAVKIQFEIDEKSSLLTLIFPTFFKIYQKYNTDG